MASAVASTLSAPHHTAVRHDCRIPELDGIRAIALLSVLIHHIFYGYQRDHAFMDVFPYAVREILSHGWLGVDLFFMLSGFLITGILLKTKEEPRYFQNFYVRRALRILPLYVVVVVVWAILYPV